MPYTVSVIVVSFNTKEKLRRCLSCIEPHHEIVVVDNASSDGSPEMVSTEFPHVKLVRNEANVGFGVANNQGCEAATGNRVLFLNSDAYAKPGAIDRLASVFEDPAIVAAGGKLLNLDETLQESIAAKLTLWRVFQEQTFIDPILRRLGSGNTYWRTTRTLAEFERSHKPVPVFQVMGACIMVRAQDGMPPELFDPRYFLYCEDTDLCRRLGRYGTIVYYPPAEFLHELGSSSKRDPAIGIIRYNRGKELYFRIHSGAFAELMCLLIDRLGAMLRLTAYALLLPVKKGSASSVRLWWRVLTAPRRSAEGSPRIPEPPRPAVQSS